jgi:hypothetical protein
MEVKLISEQMQSREIKTAGMLFLNHNVEEIFKDHLWNTTYNMLEIKGFRKGNPRQHNK